MLEQYSNFLRLQKRFSPHTRRSYEKVAEIFFDFLRSLYPDSQDPLRSLNSTDLQSFVRELSSTLSQNSQAQRVAASKSLLRWLQKQHSLELSFKSLSKPKIAKRLIQVLDEEDLKILAAFVRKRPRHEELLFELLYGSALRISEATQLKVKDLRLETAHLEILGKGRKRRQVPVTRRAQRLLEPIKASSDPQQSIWGEPKDPRTLRQWVYNWSQGLWPLDPDKKLHPHLLRHSIASHLLRRGTKLPQIQKLLGHSQLATSERYTHIDPSTLLQIYDQSHPKLKD